MDLLKKTVEDIKSLRVHGAESIAEYGLKAWEKSKDKDRATKLLINSRPTEPMLHIVLFLANSGVSPKKIMSKLQEDKKRIYKIGAKLIKNKSIVFIHCHSSTVNGILKEAKKQGKKFEVHNTETRPFYQGRITSRELAQEGIRVVHYTDSSAMVAMKKADLFLFGADAVTSRGPYNKIGTEMFAEVARKYFKIPVYCCTHSWKVTDRVRVEQLSRRDIWSEAPKKVEIHTPAFELAEAKFVTGIISELGILPVKEFVKKAREELRKMK
ncbi:MAG: hypothetical protein JSW73_03990 [Candidatus Woesearchaeota archaeon]|nr:MAG: hypothetical protein JSW73_03990 [Candidatus Woesearchaeota archaeon]